MRPGCPLCVRRECANCFHVDQQINRQWIALRHPGGECRRCGAARSAVTEKPVRHTNRGKHQDHVDAYAKLLLTKPVRRIDRDPADMTEALGLLSVLDGPVMKAMLAYQALELYENSPHITADERDREWNENTAKLLRLVPVVRRWVAENTETENADDLESLREDAAKLSALEAAGVDNWSGYDYAMEILHQRENDHG